MSLPVWLAILFATPRLDSFRRSARISRRRDLTTEKPSAAEPQPNLGISPAKAQRPQRKTDCHFDQREKSFLDPSHSPGMTRPGGSNFRLRVTFSFQIICAGHANFEL